LKRLAARCCGLGSYRLAAENLKELCGIYLSHTTVGEITQETVGELDEQLQDNSAIRDAFRKAKGEVEFQTDGTCVHIRDEEDNAKWMEVKTGVFAKRERGESAEPSEWATRDLPEPSIVSAFAAIL
jgi:hypothetical protein